MANNKKEFMVMYDQAVDLLKRFKQSNDNLNKSIGVEHDSSITLKIRAQQSSHNGMIKKLDQILQRLEQSYLDPDTARKIGTVKQQYKIQKDRRSHILQSMTQSQQNENKMPHQTSQSQNYIKYTLANSHQYSKNVTFGNRRQNIHGQDDLNTTAHTINKHNQEQITEYDYEIECKLLKQKNKVLQQTEQKLLNVYNITKECKQMVDFQGQHLDIISDQIFKAKQNTTFALKQLKQANQHSKKRRRKIFAFSLFVIIAAILLLGIIFF